MPINPPVPSGSAFYGSVESVFLLVRSLVNDTFAGATQTPGEGRIVIDSAPFMIPLYNNALNHLQRDLEVRGFPSNLTEAVLTGLAPVNGPLGPGVSDPTIQPYLSYAGWFDGNTLNAAPALPANFLTPERVWERGSSESNTFQEIFPVAAGLESRFQNGSLGAWDWRGDALYFNGSVNVMDLRLRYYTLKGVLAPGTSPASFPSIPVPWLDAIEPLAYHMAFEFCQSQLPLGQAADLQRGYTVSMIGMAARMVRQSQRVQYARPAYGDSGDIFGM